MTEKKTCLTKVDLSRAVYRLFAGQESAVSPEQAQELVETLVELMKEGLEGDGKVLISGFGSWQVYTTKPRKGRNPQTGESLLLRSRRVAKFVASKLLKEELNRKPLGDQPLAKVEG